MRALHSLQILLFLFIRYIASIYFSIQRIVCNSEILCKPKKRKEKKISISNDIFLSYVGTLWSARAIHWMIGWPNQIRSDWITRHVDQTQISFLTQLVTSASAITRTDPKVRLYLQFSSPSWKDFFFIPYGLDKQNRMIDNPLKTQKFNLNFDSNFSVCISVKVKKKKKSDNLK